MVLITEVSQKNGENLLQSKENYRRNDDCFTVFRNIVFFNRIISF